MLKRTKMKKKIQIAIFIMENTLLSSIFAIEEIFSICNDFCKKEEEYAFTTNKVSFVKSVKTNQNNIRLETFSILEDKTYDVIIIPPFKSDKNFIFDIKNLNTWLKEQYEQGGILSSACVGSFFLANTGLLNKKNATTHWIYEDLFKQNFPKVNLQSEKILIEDDNIITTAGVSAYMDLCLYIIEKYNSAKTANDCAKILLIDKKRDSQKSYKINATSPILEDEKIQKSLLWMKKNFQEEINIHILCENVNLKPRSYLRRFKKAINTSPNIYLQQLRIEKAKELLISSNKSFNEITYEVGFLNESSFRRLFKRETSLNPGLYRKKFKQYL